MGNVPISCCRSQSPNDHSTDDRTNSSDGKYSTNKFNGCNNRQKPNPELTGDSKSELKNHQLNTLQHISEREPDDSDTDPSSNPLNRPIFAARGVLKSYRQQTRELCKCASRKSNILTNNSQISTDTTGSSNLESSPIRQQLINPISTSQDQGYNSTSNSTNLNQFDGNFESFTGTNTSPSGYAGGGGLGLSNKTDGDEAILIGRYLVDLEAVNKLSKSAASEDSPGNQIQDFETNNSKSLNNNLLGNQHPLMILKTSSCSRIHSDNSTISQPNFEQIIKSVSLAVYYHIKHRSSDDAIRIFDESVHPLSMPDSSDEVQKPDELLSMTSRLFEKSKLTNDSFDDDLETGISKDPLAEPSQKTIQRFVRTLFSAAQLTAEYAITTLVYLERLMTYAEMDLTPRTWRRMFLGAILLSSKVWEDQAVWNVDYAQILEDISVEDINELERHFLELIQFNMNVPSSVYAKYYFHLRSLAMVNGFSEGHTQLTVDDAKRLESMTSTQMTEWNPSPIQRKANQSMKKYTSLEKLRLGGRSRAVLM